MEEFIFADLHCHPNLKSFGHSFDTGRQGNRKSDAWYRQPPSHLDKWIIALTGLCKFTQADFQTMILGGVKLAGISLYPFEKGFFVSGPFNGPVAAILADLVTGIGYRRVRHLQKQTSYFQELVNELAFLIKSQRWNHLRWQFIDSASGLDVVLGDEKAIGVFLSIEGAHVLNTGLEKYGRAIDETEVIENVRRIKRWRYPPTFITFSHNFNNDLCGHARSLSRLGFAVDQRHNLNKGFSKLGLLVVSELLQGQHRVYIDLKHMSLQGRFAYYEYLKDSGAEKVPIIASHAAVTGTNSRGRSATVAEDRFSQDDINFFDEEIVYIGRSGGLFGIQLDANRLASKKVLSKLRWEKFRSNGHQRSAQVVWEQIRHVAETLDRHGEFAWGTCCIGSDFDGTIDPLPGIWTSADFPRLAANLLTLANAYLKKPCRLSLIENRSITPEEIVHRFSFGNVSQFLKRWIVDKDHFQRGQSLGNKVTGTEKHCSRTLNVDLPEKREARDFSNS